ncbi:bifunctional DNA-binding transcriptional regulator/O6-methylguanine-DNA methyltransferase Ada [Stutzerimonas urumqiensis]|uniref:bifunctional DNA-binding transcriptional regulator/O6-methylguanine-DNA methyltransferase Ada n=1 Tax=Stutzerimonas urumqiensis TaxID=638269 RepID=UPI003DA48C83
MKERSSAATVVSHPVEADPRWQALLSRDPRHQDAFVYAVKSTGLYARPGTATRLPRPENVEFFACAEAAEAAGYRPGKRAAPAQREAAQAEAVARACRLIEASERLPGLPALAREANLSPYHFHRLFKTVTGLTPRAYAAAHRARRLRDGLASAPSVTDALYAAGFGSSSRLYEAADGLLGMSPADYRSGGARQSIRFAAAQCALGAIVVAESERGVCAILLGDDPELLLRDLQDRFPRAELVGGDAAFEQRVAQVVGFVEAPEIGLALPLDLRGTAFQERVWQALREIPAGQTVSYTEIANRIGAPKAVRAVAQACGANRLAVAVPCHRVVRHDGALSGYRWGIERKRLLLEREAARRSEADA